MKMRKIQYNFKSNKRKNREHGFTLVELIVVLVILAILAAILIPALLGYIDRAKGSQDILNGKNFMTAMQAEMTSLYAKGDLKDDPDIKNKMTSDSGDVSLYNTDFAKRVLETADVDPYLVFVGVGEYQKYGKSEDVATRHKAYTVYFVAYVQDANSEPVFFNGSEWSKDYPWAKGQDGKNVFTVNGQATNIQFYAIKGPSTNMSNNWTTLKSKVKTYNK